MNNIGGNLFRLEWFSSVLYNTAAAASGEIPSLVVVDLAKFVCLHDDEDAAGVVGGWVLGGGGTD